METKIFQLAVYFVAFVFLIFGAAKNKFSLRENLLVLGICFLFIVINAAFHVLAGIAGIVDKRSFLDLVLQLNPAFRDPTVPIAYACGAYCLGGMVRQLARG